MSTIKDVLGNIPKKRTRTDKIRQILMKIDERNSRGRSWTIFSPTEIHDFSNKDKRIILNLLRKYGLHAYMSVGYMKINW